jgi:chorismate dehydratase
VLLKCNKPLEQIRTVAFDPASHTSNVLAELLLKDHWRMPVEWSDDPSRADAAVTIGNRAMQLPPARDDRDLSEAWRELTGLPFVFAVWVCRRGHPRRGDMARILRDALEAGMADAPALAAEQARLLDLPPARCLHYMTESIRYRLGEREHRAMQTFESMIRQHGHALSAMSRTASPRQ